MALFDFILRQRAVSMAGHSRSIDMIRWLLLPALLVALPLQAETSTAPDPAVLASTSSMLAPAPAPMPLQHPPATQGAAPQSVVPRQILAMDRILPGTTEDEVKALLNDEVRALVNLYLGGKIRQWYFRQDRPGAVFILEVTSLEEAEKLVADLPLTRTGLLAYDLIPIGPYIPLATMIPPEGPPKRKKR